ncbi:DNA mismatch repair protein MutS [Ignavibacteria bacterium]|nr:DNA mismatch repair protein MutS [Bacteroidota bacterium]
MAEKQTPLMRQYHQIKKKNPDAVLLFRMGDFFETFEDDAVITARVCGITLTKRNNGDAGETPLAGFPHHQLDSYLPKLVRAGYRVAVCEQLEDPKLARGIVRRDVVEVVTPGVALNDKLLDAKRNNYLAAILLQTERDGRVWAGLACADISTGEFFCAELPASELAAVLETLAPAEIIISKPQYNAVTGLLARLPEQPATTRLDEWIFESDFARETLLRHFKTLSLKGFGIDTFTVGVSVAGAALHYISETQRGAAQQIRSVSAFNPSEYMTLDHATRRNLEITFSMRDAGREGTLIEILDKTCSPMGSRLFKKWIARPLRKLEIISRRLDAVRALRNSDKLEDLRRFLRETGDLERLIAKTCAGKAGPRDLVSLKNGLQKTREIQSLILNESSLSDLARGIEPPDEAINRISAALIDDPAAAVGAGSIFRDGFCRELDELRDALYSGKNWILDYQQSERDASGISSLKVGFNNVFGYYIEISNTHKSKTPERYTRKQTTANAERYITPELKEIETKILTAEERIGEVESRLFSELRSETAAFTEAVQKTAASIAALDCLQSFAQAAAEYNYTEPIIEESERLEIVGGRHPVVERLLPVGESFNANSTTLDSDCEQIHIITGPNMSGKSCYLRQVGLIVLLAQIGSFVPAERAHIGLIDRIFTRVGAQDNIVAGESTFLVEMQESANILNNATRKSLILLDEVGRGTATFDGISIAWAIAEHIHEHIGAKTLFATHYHELNRLAELFARIENYKVEVREVENSVIFSHRVVRGSTDHSFGIHVAQMAGLPRAVVHRAGEILRQLEGGDNSAQLNIRAVNIPSSPNVTEQTGQLSIFEIRDDALRAKIAAINPDLMTPLQALQTLSDIVNDVKKG